jgi:predicted nucleotidyltransferase/aryl carrier-like protein
MTNSGPRVSVTGPINLPAEVREVAEALIAELGDDLGAVLWHGSEARGEAMADSDHDVIIIMKRMDISILLRLQQVFRCRENWSSFVQTEEELRQYPPSGRFQFHFGLVPLYGDFEPPPWTRENIFEEIRMLALNIRFECRYRLLHKEPDYGDMEPHYRSFVRARNARMLRYAAKWAVMAMKARELVRDRPYPITREDLRARLTGLDEIAIIDLVERWTETGSSHEDDVTPVALQLDAFARKLVTELDTEAR